MNFEETSRIWDSLSQRHTMFWTSSADKEERVIRFARIGALVSGALLSLLAGFEILFFLILLWEVVR